MTTISSNLRTTHARDLGPELRPSVQPLGVHDDVALEVPARRVPRHDPDLHRVAERVAGL